MALAALVATSQASGIGAPPAPIVCAEAGMPVAPASTAVAPAPLFTRRDAAYLLLATTAVGVTAFNDRWATRRAIAADSHAAREFSRMGEHFGNAPVIASALVACDVAGRLAHRPRFTAASERVAISVGASTIAAIVLKEAIGRARPDASPDDAAHFRPFSGDASFPSGHTAAAFALAAALQGESRAGWVPWVAYPVATLTGWSRVRDQRHWASDVLAGAALGGWLGRKVDAIARRRWRHAWLMAAAPVPGGGVAVARVVF